MNLCRACGLDFGSLHAFDAHRVGTHDCTFREGLEMSAPREDGRRCLDEDELQESGFVRNAYGRWSLVRELERGRQLKRSPQLALSVQDLTPERLGGAPEGSVSSGTDST